MIICDKCLLTVAGNRTDSRYICHCVCHGNSQTSILPSPRDTTFEWVFHIRLFMSSVRLTIPREVRRAQLKPLAWVTEFFSLPRCPCVGLFFSGPVFEKVPTEKKDQTQSRYPMKKSISNSSAGALRSTPAAHRVFTPRLRVGVRRCLGFGLLGGPWPQLGEHGRLLHIEITGTILAPDKRRCAFWCTPGLLPVVLAPVVCTFCVFNDVNPGSRVTPDVPGVRCCKTMRTGQRRREFSDPFPPHPNETRVASRGTRPFIAEIRTWFFGRPNFEVLTAYKFGPWSPNPRSRRPSGPFTGLVRNSPYRYHPSR